MQLPATSLACPSKCRLLNLPNGQEGQVVQIRDMAGPTRLCATLHPQSYSMYQSFFERAEPER